jgi:hypothetical protein
VKKEDLEVGKYYICEFTEDGSYYKSVIQLKRIYKNTSDIEVHTIFEIKNELSYVLDGNFMADYKELKREVKKDENPEYFV